MEAVSQAQEETMKRHKVFYKTSLLSMKHQGHCEKKKSMRGLFQIDTTDVIPNHNECTSTEFWLKKKVTKKHFEDHCYNFNVNLVLDTIESISIF